MPESERPLDMFADGLYVANLRRASEPTLIKESGITHVISLGKENEIPAQSRVKGVIYFTFDMTDKENEAWADIIDKDKKGKPLIDFIDSERLFADGTASRVLVHCKHAQCRTPFILCFVLIKCKHYSFIRALQELQMCLGKDGEFWPAGKDALTAFIPLDEHDKKAIDDMFEENRLITVALASGWKSEDISRDSPHHLKRVGDKRA